MAPAMWVRMQISFVMQQSTVFTQHIHHFVIGFKDMLASKQWRISQISAVTRNRVCYFQTIFVTYHKVFLTVAWRSMHRTGTGIGGHMLTQYHRDSKIIEWMVEMQQLQIGTNATT